MLWESDLPIEDVKRFQRQVIVPKVGVEGQLLLNKSKVLVIGMGGLGSPVLMYLATTGIKKIGIVDYDRVELHNLQRQVIHTESNIGEYKTKSAADFIEKLNSTIKIEVFNEYLNKNNIEKIISAYDIIADCCDSIELRYLINDTCRILNKKLVCASVLKWEGQICVIANNSACFRCIFPEPKTNAPNCATSGVIGPVCGIIGSMQATEIFKLITNSPEENENKNYGNLIIYNSFTNKINSFKKEYKKCKVCLTKEMSFNLPFQSCSVPDKINTLSWDSIIKHLPEYKIIDIRSPEHFKLFRIKNSINIPSCDLLSENNLKKIKGFDSPVVLNCYKGISSQEKTKFLKEQGINAYSSYGGIEGFKDFIGFEDL